ncbi:GumC family protein [Leptolyngbya sp. AN02str]|uniref:GumC family protein n=1 Tax=Leptolyngbya sp. AN02str TaxID=3423363 RepID=UPI003D31E90B
MPSTSDEEGGLALGQLVAAVRRKAFLVAGVTIVVASLAQLRALTDKPVYTSGFEILTKSVTAESELLSSLPQTLSNRQQGAAPAETLDATKIRVLQSPNLLYPVVEELKARHPDISYEAIVANLKIAPNGETILTVSFTSEDAQLVEDVLASVSARYLEYSLEERQKDIRQGIKFVEEQLPDLEARVAREQEQLERFRQQFNLIDPQSAAQILAGQSGTLAQQQLDTQAQLEQARSLYSQIQAELTGQSAEFAASSALIQSPRYQKLLDQLLAIDSQLAQESALYLDSSPEIQVLQEQRQNLEPLLRREGLRVERSVASGIRELESKSQALAQAIADVNQQIKNLSTITRRYNDLQRGVEIATNNLNQFLAKREGLRIDAAQRQVPWQLLTPPGDPVPSAASLKRSLILGVVLGSLLGVGAALLLDRISNIIATTKQVRSITRLPMLGAIPVSRDLDNFDSMHVAVQLFQSAQGELSFLRESPQLRHNTPFQEAFRSLNANIRLLNPDEPVRSMTICSATPGNGKTTVSAHLALTAAAMGQRVLVVDTDLRRSRLHHQLGLKNEVGLTDVVSGSVDWRDAIQPLPWEPNAFVLSSGMTPPDPTRILASRAMRELMQALKDEFDLVIYDTPPLLGFADVYLFAAETDGLLLVVRLNHLKQSLLEQTMEELRLARVPMLGSLVNASEQTSFPSYAYYQSYGEQDGIEAAMAPLTAPIFTAPKRMKELWNTVQKRFH